jgi:hypothetical protein
MSTATCTSRTQRTIAFGESMRPLDESMTRPGTGDEDSPATVGQREPPNYEPVRPIPDVHHLVQGGVVATTGTETVGVIGGLDVVVRLQQQAHHLGDQLVRPGRQAALLPVLLQNVDPLDGRPSIALTTQSVDDHPDLLQRHAVHSLASDPRRHRPVVRVDAPVGHQVQLRIEQLSIQPFKWQSSFTALTDDAGPDCVLDLRAGAADRLQRQLRAVCPTPAGVRAPRQLAERMASRRPAVPTSAWNPRVACPGSRGGSL